MDTIIPTLPMARPGHPIPERGVLYRFSLDKYDAMVRSGGLT
jgi:hypothetical protein